MENNFCDIFARLTNPTAKYSKAQVESPTSPRNYQPNSPVCTLYNKGVPLLLFIDLRSSEGTWLITSLCRKQVIRHFLRYLCYPYDGLSSGQTEFHESDSDSLWNGLTELSIVNNPGIFFQPKAWYYCN